MASPSSSFSSVSHPSSKAGICVFFMCWFVCLRCRVGRDCDCDLELFLLSEASAVEVSFIAPFTKEEGLFGAELLLFDVF